MYLKKKKEAKAVEETVRSPITCGLEEITMESSRGQQTSCTVPDNKYLRYHRPNSKAYEVTGIVLFQKENGPQLLIDGIQKLVIIKMILQYKYANKKEIIWGRGKFLLH